MLNLLIQEQRYDIALIKVFDRIHNLQTINAKSTDKALETVKRNYRFYQATFPFRTKRNISKSRFTQFLF